MTAVSGRHPIAADPAVSGQVTAEDLAAYEVVEREPVRVHYRGHEVCTNPPPSAGRASDDGGQPTLERRQSPQRAPATRRRAQAPPSSPGSPPPYRDRRRAHGNRLSCPGP